MQRKLSPILGHYQVPTYVFAAAITSVGSLLSSVISALIANRARKVGEENRNTLNEHGRTLGVVASLLEGVGDNLDGHYRRVEGAYDAFREGQDRAAEVANHFLDYVMAREATQTAREVTQTAREHTQTAREQRTRRYNGDDADTKPKQ